LTLLGLGALSAFLLFPVACGDDDNGEPTGAGGMDAGSDRRDGAGGTGGTGGTGGSKDAGGDTKGDTAADTGKADGTGGASGAAGAAGAAGKGGASGSAGTGGTAGAAGSGGSGGTMDAGKDADLDVSVGDADVTDAGDGGPVCTAPTDPTRAKACVTFAPEPIALADAGPLLDGQGTLFIHVFDTPTPGDTTVPLAQIVYPPPNADGGLNQTSVYSLPPQIDIDNLVPTDRDGATGTVYIRTLFVDNPLWLQTRKGLTYGLFVGGYNLNNGVQPPPPLRAVTLATGAGTVVRQPLTALRRFTTQVVLGLPEGGALAGNGQGPMSLGAFNQASPANAFAFGGLQVPCVDVTTGPIPVAGFFYSVGGEVNFWIGAQVDDFGVGGQLPAGGLVSLTQNGEIPLTQRFTITADQYSASIPQVTLTGVRPPPDGGVDNVSCPAVDAGSDAAVDVGTDVGIDATSDAEADAADAASDAIDDGG
jgi:hypothetical protein